jgi:CRISPR-associated endonuclease/helicase Cas3
MSPDALKTLLRGSLTGESHPGRPLVTHLEGVSETAVRLGRDRGLLDESGERLLSQMALTHDLGKERPEWQAYLNRRGPRVNHSEGSSLFTFDATGDVMAAELVRRHHGRFPDLKEAISDYWGNDAFSVAKSRRTMREILPEWPARLTDGEWEELIETMLFEAPPCDEQAWLKARTLFSLLVAADRMNALGATSFELPPLPDFKFPDSFRETPLNAWRSEARNDCLAAAAERGSPGIYSLTLPTGAGKTCIGLETAVRWAGRHGYTSIIYVLPFISIVEQNSEVARRLFGADSVQEDHSLAILSKTEESTTPVEKLEALFRYWRLPVTVTTLAHFWDALYGARANVTMNFHRIAKSVVILDEPQSLSADHWAGLGNTLDLLSREAGAAFILMTATQPHIARGKTVELAPERHRKPRENRRRYKILPGRHPLGSFPELLKAHVPINETSGLIVANTRREALEIHRMIRVMQEEEVAAPLTEARLLFLSTWLTPEHRRRALNGLRCLEMHDRPRLLVSTQVVEAGVDLDFRWAVRDYGPFDSIVQVAGRCNRHGDETPGTVVVARFVSERGRSFASMIYSDVLLNAMDEIAAERAEFDEAEIAPLIDRYYGLVAAATKGSGLWRSITSGEWEQLPSLYDETRRGEIILVIESEGIRELAERLADEKWTLEKLESRKHLVNRLQQHSIEILLSDLKQCREALRARFFNDRPPLEQIGDTNMWLLSEEGAEMLYHPDTGFAPPAKEGDDISGDFL